MYKNLLSHRNVTNPYIMMGTSRIKVTVRKDANFDKEFFKIVLWKSFEEVKFSFEWYNSIQTEIYKKK